LNTDSPNAYRVKNNALSVQLRKNCIKLSTILIGQAWKPLLERTFTCIYGCVGLWKKTFLRMLLILISNTHVRNSGIDYFHGSLVRVPTSSFKT